MGRNRPQADSEQRSESSQDGSVSAELDDVEQFDFLEQE